MIILIDNYDSFTYNLYQMLLAQNKTIKVVRNDALSVEEIYNLKPTAIILSPGPGRPEDAGISIELIKTFAGIVPILGVCLGHQAIACAFGGEVVRCPNIMHGKTSPVFHSQKGLFLSMPQPFEAGRYHSLCIEKKSLPKSLLIDAESEDGIIMAVRHREYPVFGLQFHPESILTPLGANVIAAFLGEM